MLSPTPAVRAAFFGLFIVTAAAVGGAAVHLSAVEHHIRAEAASALRARAETAAVALTPLARPERARRLAALVGAADAALYDGRGRLIASTDDALTRAADWPRTLAALGAAEPIARASGATVVVAGADVGDSQLVLLAPAPSGLPRDAWTQTILVTACIWGLLVGALVVLAWYVGPRTAHQLSLLGERIALGRADPGALIRHAGIWLGPLAGAFQPVARRIRAQVVKAEEVKHLLAALYQINPHYVVLCTQDGEIVEANPAFYAVTGLPPEAVRGGAFGALRDTFPVEPLLEVAERSMREGSSISGIEYALVDRDDESRPVDVSLRGFRLEGRAMVLIQATDRAHERRLEQRVAAFSDTLDLMVDQRVTQLTAGQQALRRVLDAAGVVVASFDAGGATSRWSGAAEALTGRPVAAVPHFAAVVHALSLSPAEATAFTRWFWSYAPEPFIGAHARVTDDGATRTRQVVWQRVDADRSGRSDHRTLVGVEVPGYISLGAASGDGVSGGAAVRL